jgi:hypothetical protein
LGTKQGKPQFGETHQERFIGASKNPKLTADIHGNKRTLTDTQIVPQKYA